MCSYVSSFLVFNIFVDVIKLCNPNIEKVSSIVQYQNFYFEMISILYDILNINNDIQHFNCTINFLSVLGSPYSHIFLKHQLVDMLSI